MIEAIALILVALILSPIYLLFKKSERKAKSKLFLMLNVAAFFGLCLLVFGVALSNTAAAADTADAAAAAAGAGGMAQGLGYLGAGLVTGLSCLGAGIAVSGAASAALGAISENEGLFGKAFVMVVLAEGIAIYGMLISVLILNSL